MKTTTPPSPEFQPDWLARVREKVAQLRFGLAQLVVHDGRFTQIACSEKTP